MLVRRQLPVGWQRVVIPTVCARQHSQRRAAAPAPTAAPTPTASTASTASTAGWLHTEFHRSAARAAGGRRDAAPPAAPLPLRGVELVELGGGGGLELACLGVGLGLRLRLGLGLGLGLGVEVGVGGWGWGWGWG